VSIGLKLKRLINMSKLVRNTLLFILMLAIIGAVYSFLITRAIKRTSSVTETLESIPSPTQPGATPEAKELSSLLTPQNPPSELIKCHFDGNYQVTQDNVQSNGAKCDKFETRTMKLDSVSTECSLFLDPKQELFLSCTNPTNPVTKCNGIVQISVGGKRACEYWVTIQRVD
jgi:hypothetical protein